MPEHEPPAPDASLWRSPEEREAPRSAEPEFPPGADARPTAIRRRTFLGLVAGATVAACGGKPRGKVVPYVRQPPGLVPGVAQTWATSTTTDGFATGLLVTTQDGRPVHVDGNPDHPASLGGSSAQHQASVLQLYDPQRARAVERRGRPASGDALAQALASAAGERGEGLHVLLEPSSSPQLAAVLARLRERRPAARVHFFAPLASRGRAEALRAVTGEVVRPLYDLSQAEVVLSLDDDFTTLDPMALRYQRQLADRRRLLDGARRMTRLYVVEPSPTTTGFAADHRFPMRAGEVPLLAAQLVAELVTGLKRRPPGLPDAVVGALERHRAPESGRARVSVLARDLERAGAAALVVAGERQPASVHALAHLANLALGAVGRTVRYVPSPLLEDGEPSHGLARLVDALRAGDVKALAILGGNPSYAAPADLEFGSLLRKVPFTFHLGLYRDETAADCEWFAPEAHWLESWGDARAADGTVSLIQPLVAPLHGGRTPAETLAVLAGDPPPDPYQQFLDSLRARLSGPFDEARVRALQAGLLAGTESAPREPQTRWDAVAPLVESVHPPSATLELVVGPDLKVLDGRYANNAWLQELPDPITKLTWDNAAALGVATAKGLGVETGRLVELETGGRRLRVPAVVVPGHAENSVSLPLGYGRRAPDEGIALGVGADANALRTSDAPWILPVVLRALPGKRPLAITQTHWSVEGRPIVRELTLAEFLEGARASSGKLPLSLYRPERQGTQWGMAIDLSVCTGCSACVVACQSENNIPTVGRKEVLNSREMHWLRIDRYWSGSVQSPRALVQPMLCQHCEKAPCEYVCPVQATTHSPDGLNEMTYNRCVGTRFCSNNCPYKVRRFNYYDYTSKASPEQRLGANPQVSVRERGVMEKCTYCVQRIRNAEIRATREHRPLDTKEVRTACQEACPSRAIVFGDLSDPASEVSRWVKQARAYRVLEDRGTDARTRYLALVRNPNPELG